VTPAQPWLRLYPAGVPAVIDPGPLTSLGLFLDQVSKRPNDPALYFFDDVISFADLDRQSDSLATFLVERGIGESDRVALFLQNDPQFAVGELAAWKIGAGVVPINPMLKTQEVQYILQDSGAVALLSLEELYADVVEPVADDLALRVVVTTRPEDWLRQPNPLPDLLRGSRVRRTGSVEDLRTLIESNQPVSLPRRGSDPGSIACVSYTSGTSGRPKGVMTTHHNLTYNSAVYQHWMDITSDDVFLCGTPIFHITGLVAGLALMYRTGMPVVLFHRFDTGEFLRLAEKYRCSFTVMAITAYQALMGDDRLSRADLSSLQKVYSGGAPVAPAVANEWKAKAGTAIHNIYGLTETTSPSHAAPLFAEIPVDEETGALSVGVPVPGASVRVVDPMTLQDLPPGQSGEIWISGPMVTVGYLNLPESNEESFRDGYLRTGDIGKMDDDGWFYIVDRLKDMINASGFKVSPREVEDFLYQHPAVREAAVVGVPDPYRGETVKAFVVLKSLAVTSPEEIVEFCRQQMASYKYPRIVEIVTELPKTASGKILRRELRAFGGEKETIVPATP
jgi:long-chain acyl-CoA synthetase